MQSHFLTARESEIFNLGVKGRSQAIIELVRLKAIKL